jgi:hypothetical protein
MYKKQNIPIIREEVQAAIQISTTILHEQYNQYI